MGKGGGGGDLLMPHTHGSEPLPQDMRFSNRGEQEVSFVSRGAAQNGWLGALPVVGLFYYRHLSPAIAYCLVY